MFCCTLLYVHFSIAIILMGKRELIALLNLSSWCLVMVERLFLTVPWGCLQFVIVVFPDHTHLLFLKLKARKCQLFAKRVDFFGHVISEDGISTDPKKTECVQNWPDPTTMKEVRSFLGFSSCYRRFIFRFSEIVKILHKLAIRGVRFKWTKECHNANAPVLAHLDFNYEFILDVDACDQSIGVVISQKIHREEHAIAFARRALTKSEGAYCVTRKEL